MPHVVLDGGVNLKRVVDELPREVRRFRAAVLKTEEVWCRADGNAALVEGVVVEHARPLHPVAVISSRHGDTSVRLWRLAPVERTPAVQRWLAHIAKDVQTLGAGPVASTNLSTELVQDVGLVTVSD